MYERGYRSLSRMVLILLAIPVFYYVVTESVAYVSGPTLYDRDRLETRKCRECWGTGEDEALELEIPQLGDRCPFCGGKGVVEVIVPGPNRPVRLWGAVVDLEASAGAYEYSNPANVRMIPLQSAFMPEHFRRIEGAIGGAVVRFLQGGEELISVKSDPTGRFSCPLPPGTYTIVVTSAGHARLEESIRLEPLSAAIWQEKAHLVRELGAEEARSANGMSLLAALCGTGEKGAFVRLAPAYQ